MAASPKTSVALGDGVFGACVAGRSGSWLCEEAHGLIEASHRAVVGGLPAGLERVAGYHAGWWDGEGRACASVGKAVRPALVVASARAACGGGGYGDSGRAVVAAAVAVAVVHDFTLLHDDVMDGDRTRRGRPAAWTVFGPSQAILAGDALLVLALEMVNGTPWATVLTQALLEVCAGQSADLAFPDRDDVSIAECLAMAEGKTSALIGAACQLGALAAGADMTTADRFRRFGRELGLAFQLIDDLLGIWGDPRVTGKPTGSDLVSRKKSLPVVAALQSGTPAGRQLARLCERDDPFDASTVMRAAELVEAAGGRAWARTEAQARIAAALDALPTTDPANHASADLQTLAALITRRDH